MIDFILTHPQLEGFIFFLLEVTFMFMIAGIYLIFVLTALNLAWCIRQCILWFENKIGGKNERN